MTRPNHTALAGLTDPCQVSVTYRTGDVLPPLGEAEVRVFALSGDAVPRAVFPACEYLRVEVTRSENSVLL